MINNKLGYCRYGSEIWIEYLWNGMEWFERFSGTDFQEITQCPDCGTELTEDAFES
jgi:hypothetical protein